MIDEDGSIAVLSSVSPSQPQNISQPRAQLHITFVGLFQGVVELLIIVGPKTMNPEQDINVFKVV